MTSMLDTTSLITAPASVLRHTHCPACSGSAVGTASRQTPPARSRSRIIPVMPLERRERHLHLPLGCSKLCEMAGVEITTEVVPLTNPRALVGVLANFLFAAGNLGADTGATRPVDVVAR